MTQELKVVRLSELRQEFDKYYLDRFCNEVLKRADRRYFTREKIYLFLVIALFTIIGFSWGNLKMINSLKDSNKPVLQKNIVLQ